MSHDQALAGEIETLTESNVYLTGKLREAYVAALYRDHLIDKLTAQLQRMCNLYNEMRYRTEIADPGRAPAVAVAPTDLVPGFGFADAPLVAAEPAVAAKPPLPSWVTRA